MITVGGLYLLFEDSIVEQAYSAQEKETKYDQPVVSRAVVGIQVSIAAPPLLSTLLTLSRLALSFSR
jgi:hypothetical protein